MRDNKFNGKPLVFGAKESTNLISDLNYRNKFLSTRSNLKLVCILNKKYYKSYIKIIEAKEELKEEKNKKITDKRNQKVLRRKVNEAKKDTIGEILAQHKKYLEGKGPDIIRHKI